MSVAIGKMAAICLAGVEVGTIIDKMDVTFALRQSKRVLSGDKVDSVKRVCLEVGQGWYNIGTRSWRSSSSCQCIACVAKEGTSAFTGKEERIVLPLRRFAGSIKARQHLSLKLSRNLLRSKQLQDLRDRGDYL